MRDEGLSRPSSAARRNLRSKFKTFGSELGSFATEFKVRDDTFVTLRYRGAARSATNELGLGHAAPREA